MTEEASKETSEYPPITIDELFAFGSNVVLERNISFEATMHDKEPKEQMITRKVIFRRLTYEEIDNLRSVPDDKPLRYASAVILTASLNPKFENVDQIVKAPHGFVRHYSALILSESGKNPFLGKG